MSDEISDDAALRALANENRRRLLRLVRDDERSVGELAYALELSQPAVSQHLAVLRDSGLVTVTPAGRRRLYRADNEAVAAAGRFFAEYWADATDRLAAAAVELAAGRGAARIDQTAGTGTEAENETETGGTGATTADRRVS